MQPDYSSSDFKFKAREENIAIYRRLTGNTSIPSGRGYWTLCNLQPPTDKSEIVQLVKAGMISKRQFFGVDMDTSIIAKNRQWHPDANWLAGEWLEVLWKEEEFNPGMVYLDTTSFVDSTISIRLASQTMDMCPQGTVLLVNAMLTDPRSRRRFDPDKFLAGVARSVPQLGKWDSQIAVYEYSTTGRTRMVTLVFYRRL